MKKLEHEFIKKAYLKADIKLLSVYQFTEFRNDLECLKCGYLWKAAYSDFKSHKNGCPKCGIKNRTLDHEFIKNAYLKADITLLSVYVTANHNNDLECLKCSYLWKADYNHFQSQNSGCPKCSGKLKHTQEFVEASYLKANIKLLSVYINCLVKNYLLCLKCDHKWQANFNNYYNRNTGCPECERLSRMGETNPHWNYELTKEDRENSYNRKHIPDTRLWVKAVYDRDKYICQCCSYSKGGSLNAHHIDSWKEHKDDRFNIDNGVTLCETCHRAYHSLYKIVNHDSFYCWIIRKSVIKAANWSWFVRYPDSMNERLKYFKR